MSCCMFIRLHTTSFLSSLQLPNCFKRQSYWLNILAVFWKAISFKKQSKTGGNEFSVFLCCVVIEYWKICFWGSTKWMQYCKLLVVVCKFYLNKKLGNKISISIWPKDLRCWNTICSYLFSRIVWLWKNKAWGRAFFCELWEIILKVH